MVWSHPIMNLPHTSVIYFSTKTQGKLGKGSFSEAAEQLGAEGSPRDLCRVSQDLLWMVISSWAPRGAERVQEPHSSYSAKKRRPREVCGPLRTPAHSHSSSAKGLMQAVGV